METLTTLSLLLVSILFIYIIVLKKSTTTNHQSKQQRKKLVIKQVINLRIDQKNEEQIIVKKKKKKTKKHKTPSDIKQESEEEIEQQITPQKNIEVEKDLLAEKKQEQTQVISEEELARRNEIRYQLILSELDLIRSYFLNDLKQIIPFSPISFGSYEIQLSDSYGSSMRTSVVFSWKYNNIYPYGGLDINLKQSAYLTRLDSDMVNDRLKQLKLGNNLGDNPLFGMLTKVFQRIIELGRPIPTFQDQSKSQIIQQYDQSHINQSNRKILKQSQQIDNQLGEQSQKSQQSQSQLKQQKKPQLQTLVNQMMVFYPHDLIEAPQWGDSQTIDPVKPSKLTTDMRYKREFQQIKKIGEGGFGRVYLAKNKFDENIYAVKKCLLNETDPKYKKTIKQVTLLSQLNHPNIVRYHQSWTEQVETIQELMNELQIEEQQQKELQQQFKKWKHDKIQIQFAQNDKNDEDSDSLEDQLDRMQDLSISSQGIYFGINNESIASLTRKKKFSQSKSHIKGSDDQQSENNQNKSHLPFKILYIAMQYCGQHTLKDWIQKMRVIDKNKLQEQRTYIFREILQALVYIHDKKIIHRDLKPPNIFWDEKNNRIKLGDFGVATNLHQDKFNIVRKDYSNDRIDLSDKTKGVGTPIYRAPQQFSSGKYNQKADIYSLGIIFFQMNYTFSTRMQRQQTIAQLKNGIFPSQFKSIQTMDIIKSLLKKDPNERPSARSLLLNVRNDYFGQIVSTIANPRHFQFRQLLDCIFKIQNHPTTKTFQSEAFNHLDYKKIENVFKCHGGSNLHLSPIIPVQDYFTINGVKITNRRQGKFLMISPQGVILELSNNAYKPWINWLNTRSIQKRLPYLKRYSFAQTIYNKQEIFKQKRRGVFDLIYPISSTSFPLQYECEVIRMSIQIQPDAMITLGHSHFISLFCKQNKLNQQLLYGILHSQSFKKYQQMNFEKKLEQLKKYNLQQALCHKILAILEVRSENLETFQKDIKYELQKSNVDNVFSYLKQLMRILELLGVVHVQFKVGIPPEHCNGIYWKTDRLRGFASIQNWQKQEIGTLHVQVDLYQIPRPLPDVYVWSVGQYLQKQIIQIVTECWENDLHAEWSKAPKGQKVQNVKIGVILKRGQGQKRVLVSIKNFQNAKDSVDWIPKQNFSVDLILNLLKNEANRIVSKQSKSHNKE